MKNLLHILFFFIPIMGFPQGTPQGISYQAVAYDSDGFEISNQDISVRLGILLGSVDAEDSYTEVHTVTTDDFGLFSLVISEGETSDTFSSINWEQGAYLKVEVDANLDGEYSIMGVSSFNAVPYALYAPTDNRVDSLLSLFEYKFELMNRPLQESLDMGVSFLDLYSVGFQKDQFIGLNYQGGIVFYIDETGEHGLVAALEDIGIFEWGCFGTDINGNNFSVSPELQAIGTGYQNTMDIVVGCPETPIAASEALAYESEGYSDWYLPSIDELKEMYDMIGQGSSSANIGGFLSTYYWSSSEDYSTNAWCVGFDGGYAYNDNKYATNMVRIIRAF